MQTRVARPVEAAKEAAIEYSPLAKRMGYGLLLVLFVASTVLIQAIGPINSEARYNLSPLQRTLLGESRDDTKEYLKYDAKSKTYSFTVPEAPEDGSMKLGRNEQVYSADLSQDAKDGISYTDSTTDISMTLKPKFWVGTGKKVEGDHVVYPAGAAKLVYTLKYNGLKEDIVIPEFLNEELSYAFEMSLPAGVEARLDKQGNIGIYSSDPKLFGNISFGSDADREKIEKARQNGEKNNLVATIPAPIVKDAQGAEYTDRAEFKLDYNGEQQQVSQGPSNIPEEVKKQLASKSLLNRYTLTIAARNLKELAYPISLDPTIQSTSSNDFAKGNLEGNISLDNTNGLIRRASLTGGSLGTWTTNAVGIPVAGYAPQMHAYNGKMYYLRPGSAIQTADINTTTGSVGTFTSTGVTAPNFGHTILYNGTIYGIGGLSGSGESNQVSFAIIGSNGTIGAFTATGSNFTTVRSSSQLAAYNGYLYVSGGQTTTGCPVCTTTNLADVQVAKINGDGTLGTWASAGSNFTTARALHRSPIYNGYLYIMGGWDGGGLGTQPIFEVQFARINSDGTLGTWRTATPLSTTRTAGMVVAHAGYMYAIAGSDNISTAHYAPIYADGSLGSWTATSSITNGRGGVAQAVYGDYLYMAGGGSGNGTVDHGDIQYTNARPAGALVTWATTNSVSTSRVGHSVRASNGYIYAIGGCTLITGGSGDVETCTTATATIEYGTLSANGSITWNGTTTALPAARWGMSVTIHNRVMYVTGGCEVGLLGACSRQSNTYWATISSTGTIGAWTTDADTFTARAYHGSAAYNGYLYILGGETASNTQTGTVQKSQLQSNGSPGAWSNETALPNADRELTAVAYDGYLYSFIPSTVQGLVSIAINTNGTLGASWNNVIDGSGGGSGLYGSPEIFLDRGYIYVVHPNSGRYTEYGRLTSSGGVVNTSGGTTTLTTASPTATMVNPHDWSDAVTSYNGFIYAISGCQASTGSDCNTFNTTAEYVEVLNGGSGSTSSWSTDATNLPTARGANKTVILNGYIYSIGGCTTGDQNNCSPVGTGEYAQIQDDGSIGAWTALTAGIIARKGQAMFVHNGRIYVAGGCTNTACSASTRTIQYATPTGTGNITTWTTNATNLTADMQNFTIVISDGYAYRVGATAATEYASVNATSGEIGSWTTTSSLLDSLYLNVGVALNGGYIYAVNGNTGTVPHNNQVQFAQINADHTLSAWKYTSETNIATQEGNVVAYNGFLYRITGSPTGTIEYAPIGANGHLGDWVRAVSDIPTARYTIGAPIWNGRVYIVTGLSGSSLSSAQNYALLQSIPRSGTYSRQIDFERPVRPTKVISRGNRRVNTKVQLAYQNNNNSGASLINSQTTSDIGYAGAEALPFSLGTNVTLARYLYLRYTIDEAQSAIFPDEGNSSTISDFDLYFTANPGARLRGGRTFIDGADRGLDAQP